MPTDTTTRASRPSVPALRPAVRGKSFYLGEQKLTVRGVTYGPFSSTPSGGFDLDTANADFAQMVDAGINAIRLYTPPPLWLLDLAHQHGLLVMVGIPWEQHIAFLDTGAADAIELGVREAVRESAEHPAILCYAVGNEIPSSIVRWHGRKRIERFLARLCNAARETAPGALITYVNFPPTEYLRLSCFDFLSFNVYLERREALDGYLARLQNLADDRPLLLAEVGLDSRRNGVEGQAKSLSWQLAAGARAGCAGTFVFAWTDQWHRGGHEVRDWEFGLTTRERRPKPALAAVSAAYRPSSAPRRCGSQLPLVSVAVCTNNGAGTLSQCLAGVLELRYPNYEVIVVSDGSTDDTVRIAREHQGVRVVETPRAGLSAARNIALEHARGEIVAYLDDDAAPDPDWLTHLAASFASGPYAAVGGPNVPPPESGRVAQCVANAPGGPSHVLVSDRDAEHIPGCNMSIRRDALQLVGGFDARFRAAGDDVDVCWRLLDRGERIAFSPGAVVYHHRRATVRGYLRQQRGYGRAEAMLERKHPEKYSPVGHVAWAGRLYGNGSAQHRGGRRWRVYYGGWGTASYQPLYGPREGLLDSLPLMPEWYMTIAALMLLSAGGAIWRPALLALPFLGLAIAALLTDAALGAARARFSAERGIWRLRLLTGLLYLLQPLARLQGRLMHGLTPWRERGRRGLAVPRVRSVSFWCERWLSTEDRVHAVAAALRRQGAVVSSGGDWDRWDLEVRGGLLAAARLRLAIEEHGSGNQLVRVRSWPRVPRGALVACAIGVTLATYAACSDGDAMTLLLAAVAALLVGRTIYESGLATSVIRETLPDSFMTISQPPSLLGRRLAREQQLAESLGLATRPNPESAVERGSRALGGSS
jgi:GT2 family glycosyltransferase